MNVKKGQTAPEFSLYDSNKQKRSLSDFRGKNVLLLFFPQAFTSVCTTELCNVRDDISRYSNGNAEVIAISVDSLYTLAKFKELQNYNFPMLSDFNKEVSEQYGTLYPLWNYDMKGVSKRSAFLIDKEGMIQYAEVLENAGDVPDFDKINQELSQMK